MAMLELASLGVNLAGLRALDLVDLVVGEAEAVALVGPNGSGKTTLLNAISGNVPLSSGTVRFDGKRIDGLAPQKIARLGVARALQHPRPYGRMTVAENLAAACAAMAYGWRDFCGIDRGAAAERRGRVQATLELVGLAAEADLAASSLPLAAQRRLNLAQALVREPRLLLLDEPAGGLASEEALAMAELLRTRVLPGRAAIVIDHDLALLRTFCRRFVVLQAGRKLADGPPEAVLGDAAVHEAMFGGAADARG